MACVTYHRYEDPQDLNLDSMVVDETTEDRTRTKVRVDRIFTGEPHVEETPALCGRTRGRGTALLTRRSRSEPFCSAFSFPLVIAVGAGDIFRTSSNGHGLLPLLPQLTILHAQHQQCLTGCFGRIARRSCLLTNHAPHAVASFRPLHGRRPSVLAPFQCRRPPVHWAMKCLARLNR